MRTIRFRGKRIGAPNEWIFGDYNEIDGATYIFDRGNMAPANSPDWYEVERNTVGQLAELWDADGKPIWEGDKVVCLDEYGKDTGNVDVVEFKNDSFWLRDRDVSLHKWHMPNYMNGRVKVIGNIHDNC